MPHSSRIRRLLYAAFIAGWTLQVRAQSLEETKLAAARQLGQAGIERYMDGDNPDALDKLQRAYELYQAPTLGLWYGRALERAGRLVAASERYREVALVALSAEAPAAFHKAQLDAKQALAAIAPRLAQLMIGVPGIDITQLHVNLDSAELPAALLGVPMPVDPGAHTLKAVLGDQTVEQSVQLAPGQSLSTSLAFPPAPAAEPPPAEPPSAAAAVTTKSGLAPAPFEPPAQGALSRAQVVVVMQAAQSALDDCGHGRSGSATADLSIDGASGFVQSVKVELDARFIEQLFGSGTVTREQQVALYTGCFTGVLQRLRFPRFDRPLLEVQYAFRFAPPPVQRVDAERAQGEGR